MRLFLILAGLAAVVFVAMRPAGPAAPVAVATSMPQHRGRPLPATGDDAVVYVAGAVVRPGLYRLRTGMRADDAVRRAGGLRPDADRVAVNLAERIKDGEEVVVPVLGGPTPGRSRRRSTTRAEPMSKKKTPSVMNVNTATVAELATLPGIGATLAARIVEVRDRDGAFASLDELLDVSGMTPARLERASQYLEI